MDEWVRLNQSGGTASLMADGDSAPLKTTQNGHHQTWLMGKSQIEFQSTKGDVLPAHKNQSQCLADLCGVLHCDIEINFGLKKSKCNPAAAAKNKHLCERDEKGNSTVEAHLSNWQKEKTILMDRSVAFGSYRFSNTFRIHRSLLICDSGYCTPNSAIGECSWRRRARKTAKSAPRFTCLL